MNAIRFKYFEVLTLAVLVSAGCASSQVRLVSDSSDLSGEEIALVAFSADSVQPLALRGLEIVTFSDSNRPKKAGDVTVFPELERAQLFLFEFSVETARLGVAKFEFESEFWESVGQGPEFSVEPGSLTYLGRIQMPAMQMGTYADSGRNYPASARIVMIDASEDDLRRLAIHFPSTANMPLKKAIPKTWNNAEKISLRYAPVRNLRPKKEGPDPLHDPPVPTEQIFEPTEIPPQ